MVMAPVWGFDAKRLKASIAKINVFMLISRPFLSVKSKMIRQRLRFKRGKSPFDLLLLIKVKQ